MRPCTLTPLLLLLGRLASLELAAQTARPGPAPLRWVIDPARSLAWWQVDPNYGHLWASTCPDDPSWQAGEGRSSEFRYVKDPKVSQSETHSATIPMWPRDSVRPVCRQAVRGEVTSADSQAWRGVRATVRVIADSITMGAHMRDAYMHKAVLQTTRYPELGFTLDSLMRVVPGDTIRAVAVGTFAVHGAQDAVATPVVAWRDGDGLRVQAQFGVAARRMTEAYGMSRFALGMGVGLRRWNTLHMGVDLYLRRAAP